MAQPLSDESILFAALEKASAEERAVYLDEVCSADADQRRRIERLLHAQAKVGGFLEAPAAVAAATSDDLGPENVGQIIGHYKLLEQIGEGGFGEVFLAEQQQPIRRRVALKVLKPGMDSKQVVARFEAERQALALMDHPNIARVLDAGTTETARPYFVMELVKGIAITQYCDQCSLTTQERLELFLSVCSAVQHAHQKAVIHRDIKPSNVLVAIQDSKPTAKVIDFGIAKAINQRLSEHTLLTGFHQMIGTPLYMSPEQAEMSPLDVDTRADIYSLGVLLYELLTGTTPFEKERLSKASYDELRRIIREEEPPRPSARLSTLEDRLATVALQRRTEPRQLLRVVKGELDWIVMKALEKDRNRRYETANDFAMDVQRYLADEPVLACPPSVGYRLRKFVRRNKVGLATAGLLLGFLVLLGSGAGWVAHDHAARRLVVEQAVASALEEADRDQELGRWPEALAAVERATAALAGGADGELQRRVEDRLVDLRMVERVEQIRQQRSQRKDGWAQASSSNQAYADAFRDYGIDVKALSADEAGERIRSRKGVAMALAAALDDWALLQVNDPSRRHALLTAATVADPDPWRKRVRRAVGNNDRKALEQLAAEEECAQQPPATILLLWLALVNERGPKERPIELLYRAQGQYPADFWINFMLGGNLLAVSPARTDEAVSFLRAAVARRPQSNIALVYLGRALRTQRKRDEAIACYKKALEVHPQDAHAHGGLGTVLADQGKLDEAMAHCKKALELDPKSANPHCNVGLILYQQGKLDEATAFLKKALQLDPQYPFAHAGLGNVLADQGKLDEAIVCFKKAIELDPDFAAAHGNLGLCLKKQDKLEEAIACYKKALEIDPKRAAAHNLLGSALSDKGNHDEAITCYKKALEFDPTFTMAHVNLGSTLYDQGKLDEAMTCYTKALELNPRDARAHGGLGNSLSKKGKLDEAIACYRKALEIDPKYANAHYSLGNALRRKGMLDEAIACYRTSIALKPDFPRVHFNLGWVLKKQGKVNEAIACYKRALELDPKDAQAHNNLGSALKQQGKRIEAVACYEKAIEIDPKLAIAHQNLGEVLLSSGKFDEAIACFQKLVKLEPESARACNNLGFALSRKGRLEEAIAYYKKALEIDSKYTTAADNLYAVTVGLLARGKLCEAEIVLRDLTRLQPSHQNAWVLLGQTLKQQARWEDALAVYQEATRRFPTAATAQANLAELLATCPMEKLRDPQRAVQAAKRAVELDPKRAWHWQTLGWANYRAGAWKASIAALDEAVKGSNKGAGFFGQWIVLAMAHWQLGNQKDVPEQEQARHRAEARRWYDQAIKAIDANPSQSGSMPQIRAFRAEAAKLFEGKHLKE